MEKRLSEFLSNSDDVIFLFGSVMIIKNLPDPQPVYPIAIRSRPIAIRSEPIATRFEFCVKTSSDCSDTYIPLFIRSQTILPFGSDRTRSDPIGPDRADSCPIGPDSHPITADRADWRPIGPIGDFDPPLIGQKDVSCKIFL